jgi:hypothetical protein
MLPRAYLWLSAVSQQNILPFASALHLLIYYIPLKEADSLFPFFPFPTLLAPSPCAAN